MVVVLLFRSEQLPLEMVVSVVVGEKPDTVEVQTQVFLQEAKQPIRAITPIAKITFFIV